MPVKSHALARPVRRLYAWPPLIFSESDARELVARLAPLVKEFLAG